MFTKEMQDNLNAYEKIKEKLEAKHNGKHAVIHNGELDSIYNDQQDAYKIACDRFGIGHFALKTVGKKPISLGIYTSIMTNG